jgi:flagellar basal body rod protein FlgF
MKKGTMADAIRHCLEQLDVLAVVVENLANGSTAGARRELKKYKGTDEYLDDVEHADRSAEITKEPSG